MPQELFGNLQMMPTCLSLVCATLFQILDNPGREAAFRLLIEKGPERRTFTLEPGAESF
jgi:hypothetical protein